MFKRIMLFGLIFLILLTGCVMFPENSAGSLNDTSWSLKSYSGNTLLPGSAMTAIFNDGEVSGSASCNHYFGSYNIQGDLIQIEELGWTEMACLDPESIMEQEQIIMNLLSRADHLKVQELQLIIMTTDGEELVFQALNRDK